MTSPATPGAAARAWLAATFHGLTWKAAGQVFVVNTLVTAGLKLLGIDNPFPDLLVSAQIVGFSIMLAVYAAANARPRRLLPRPGLLALSVVLGSLVGTVLVVLVKGRSVTAMFGDMEALWRFSTTAGLGIAIGAIGAIIFSARARAAEATAERHRAEAERQALARQIVEARLKLLQAQVEPHFLYNTLANVQGLIETDPPAASRMLEHLIGYLRAALPQMREQSSTLGREADLARAYLSILQMRMGKRLGFEIALPDSLRNEPFPPMMLMTLLENAVKHGVEPVREGGTITVSMVQRDGRLRLSVADTGRGFPPGGSNAHGVGLSNLRDRLLTLYGNNARLTLEGNQPNGVVASIEIPVEEAASHHRRGRAAAAPATAPQA
jgi:sensor histidine kinase YesM